MKNTPRKLCAFLLGLTALAGVSPVQADIYVYRDKATGSLYVTNIRQSDPGYKLVEVKRERKKSAVPQTGKVNYSTSARNALRPIDPPPHLDALVNQAALDYQVDKALVHAVIHAESAFDPWAISSKGARGLMQLMPGTAKRYGVNNIFDPAQNIAGGVKYMRDLLQTFGNNTRLALAAYNAGENSVLRYGGVPPYPETVDYVEKVLKLHSLYRRNI